MPMYFVVSIVIAPFAWKGQRSKPTLKVAPFHNALHSLFASCCFKCASNFGEAQESLLRREIRTLELTREEHVISRNTRKTLSIFVLAMVMSACRQSAQKPVT